MLMSEKVEEFEEVSIIRQRGGFPGGKPIGDLQI